MISDLPGTLTLVQGLKIPDYKLELLKLLADSYAHPEHKVVQLVMQQLVVLQPLSSVEQLVLESCRTRFAVVRDRT
jgi:hypothetical protein